MPERQPLDPVPGSAFLRLGGDPEDYATQQPMAAAVAEWVDRVALV